MTHARSFILGLVLVLSAATVPAQDPGSLNTGTSACAAAIHEAVQGNDLAAVRRPVDADAALANLPDKARNTPLHLAAAGGYAPIAEYLPISRNLQRRRTKRCTGRVGPVSAIVRRKDMNNALRY